MLHKLGNLDLVPLDVKVVDLGVAGLELRHPLAFEVGGVDQGHLGRRVHRPGRKQLLNLLVSFAFDPAVDLLRVLSNIGVKSV